MNDVKYMMTVKFNDLMKDSNDGDDPATLEIPQATIGDVQMGDITDITFDVETDERLVEVSEEEIRENQEESIFRDLNSLESKVAINPWQFKEYGNPPYKNIENTNKKRNKKLVKYKSKRNRVSNQTIGSD